MAFILFGMLDVLQVAKEVSLLNLGEISLDNYILGSITLYIDIVRFFLNILEILSILLDEINK